MCAQQIGTASRTFSDNKEYSKWRVGQVHRTETNYIYVQLYWVLYSQVDMGMTECGYYRTTKYGVNNVL